MQKELMSESRDAYDRAWINACDEVELRCQGIHTDVAFYDRHDCSTYTIRTTDVYGREHSRDVTFPHSLLRSCVDAAGYIRESLYQNIEVLREEAGSQGLDR